jgi:alkylation response protein AidB-like acyl-CoA dehydrogenase
MVSIDAPTWTTPPLPSDRLAWLDRVRAIAPIVGEWRSASDDDHQLPAPLFEHLRAAGFFAIAADTHAGGASVRDELLYEVIEELSRLDASVGWNVDIAAHAAVVASHLPPATLREAYRHGPNTVFAGGLLPRGLAIPEPGGYCLNGRWSFASGCRQADWIVAPGTVVVDGAPQLRADGRPELRAFCVPAADCDILDTWDTVGLRGTGSHDFQLTNVFVPEAWSFPIQPDGEDEPVTLIMSRFLPYAQPGVAAVALGIARDAIDSFVELASTKVPTLGSMTLANRQSIQERVGRAEALVRSARAFLYETVRELPPSPNWSTAIGDPLTTRIRLASAHAVQSAAEAVDLMFTAAGTSSIFAGSRLERCFRDIHVVTQHAAVGASNIELAGQFLLGLGIHNRR